MQGSVNLFSIMNFLTKGTSMYYYMACNCTMCNLLLLGKTTHRAKMNCTMSNSLLKLTPYNSTWTWPKKHF